MEKNIQKIKDLQFRKEKLIEQTKKIETLLSGKYLHYYRFMQDQKGHYSEEKTWEMIETLLDDFKKYDVYFLEMEEWDEEEIEESLLTEKGELFIKSYLYCVLRWGYSGIGYCGSGSGKGNFEDILDMAKSIGRNVNYKEEDLLYDEKYNTTDDPFYTFNELYEKVMNESAHSSAKEEALIKMREKYAAEIESIERYGLEQEKALIDAYGGEMTLEEIDNLDWEQNRAFAEEDEYIRIEIELYEYEQKAIERFANKEVFAEQYLLFRDLYFQMDSLLLWRMSDVLEGMLDIYLYQNNLSKFLDDELFFETFAMLRKVTNHVQKYLPEEVK